MIGLRANHSVHLSQVAFNKQSQEYVDQVRWKPPPQHQTQIDEDDMDLVE